MKQVGTGKTVAGRPSQGFQGQGEPEEQRRINSSSFSSRLVRMFVLYDCLAQGNCFWPPFRWHSSGALHLFDLQPNGRRPKKHTQNVPIPPFANCVTAEPALKKKFKNLNQRRLVSVTRRMFIGSIQPSSLLLCVCVH